MGLKLNVRDINFGVAFFDCVAKESGKNYTGVVLSRSYKDKNNEWQKETLHIFSDDLLKIANLCTRAYSEYRVLEDKDKDKNPIPNKKEVEKNIDDIDDDIPF